MKYSIIFLVILSLLLGCATFKSDMAGKFKSPAERNYKATGVSVFFIFSHYRQTKGYDAIPKLDNQRQRISGFDDFFQDALNEFSNIAKFATFTEYASDVNEPERRATKDSLKQKHDFVMNIKFKRENFFARHFLGRLVSIFSATILPMPYTNKYSVHVDLFNSKGQLLKTYSREAKLTKWVQTILIFFYPFHPEKRKKEEIYVNFLHDIFKQIETEKVLSK